MTISLDCLRKNDLFKNNIFFNNQAKKQSQQNLSENKNIFGTMNIIALNNKEANKANLQEMAKLISEGIFKENFAKTNGGAISFPKDETKIENINFTNNTASHSGAILSPKC